MWRLLSTAPKRLISVHPPCALTNGMYALPSTGVRRSASSSSSLVVSPLSRTSPCCLIHSNARRLQQQQQQPDDDPKVNEESHDENTARTDDTITTPPPPPPSAASSVGVTAEQLRQANHAIASVFAFDEQSQTPKNYHHHHTNLSKVADKKHHRPHRANTKPESRAPTSSTLPSPPTVHSPSLASSLTDHSQHSGISDDFPVPSPEPFSPSLGEIALSSTIESLFALRVPCHPLSLLSIPVLNQVRGSLHSPAFHKMVYRASIGPTEWKAVPEWDFDDELKMPSQKGQPTWSRMQEVIASQIDFSSNTALRQEPFTKALIEANMQDFLLSPHLHQCRELIDAIEQGQRRFFALSESLPAMLKEQLKGGNKGESLKAQRLAIERAAKERLNRAWLKHEVLHMTVLVNQFVKFMDEPVDNFTKEQEMERESLKEAIAKAIEMKKGNNKPKTDIPQDQLLKTRSGRLRFDPNLEELSNLSAPHEWYPLARSLPRKFIVHVGPTNSGKTYHAMQRLMQAESGLYAGPLRLLAWEVYDKMIKAGVACDLRTGQELEETPGARHTSSTVEMVSTSTIIDVAVIDEVQMLASNDRGSAWTRAILGIPAYEIHVCGDPSMVEMVEELCAITGEEVEIREYQRLTPLVVSPPMRGGLREVRKGDCIVAFSRKELYRLKKEIEHSLGLKCCIIYGSLPPETRRNQAELFNSPKSGYDVLLASDAIGMGLNLNIGRVIFAAMQKFDGYTMRALTPSETLQIAGRAGRYNTNRSSDTDHSSVPEITTVEEAATSNKGYVTVLNPDDHSFLVWSMAQKLLPMERAGLAPTYEQLQELHLIRPKETLANLITYFAHYAKLDQIYFSIDMDSVKSIADAIEHVPFESLKDRFQFCQAPVRIDLPILKSAIVKFAELFAAKEKVHLKSFKVPTISLPKNDNGFLMMENLYAILDLYVWLGLRFGEDIFVDTTVAKSVREKTAEIIATGLEKLSPPSTWLAKKRSATQAMQMKREAYESRRSRYEKSLATTTDAYGRRSHPSGGIGIKKQSDALSTPGVPSFTGPRKSRPLRV